MPDRSTAVAIIGAGAIGCATAAYLQARRHRVTMWSPNGSRMQRSGSTASFTCSGALSATIEVTLLQTADDLSAFETILICLPGYAYADVLAPLASRWRNGQTLIVSGSLSLCPLWLAEEAQARGKAIQAVGWGTTAATAHFQSDGTLHVNPLRNALTSPLSATATLRSPRCNFASSFWALASSPPIICSRRRSPTSIRSRTQAEVIPNLTRMERGEVWSLFEHFTSVVARLAEKLDRERLAIAEAYGFSLPSLQQHYGNSYHLTPKALDEMAAEIHRNGMSPNGPDRLEHRYVLEDVPFGLVFMEALARIAGVATPTLSASITLLEAAYDRDFRAANVLVRALSLDATDASALRMRCAAASNVAMLSRRAPVAR
jgi:opine dehydrogenase